MLRKLSSTLGQLKKGYAYDSTYGKTPISQVVLAPALADVDVVHADITLPATGTTVVTTAITNPDVARNITVTGNAATAIADVVIFGTDINGRTVTETITANGAGTVGGYYAFAEVKSITVGARGAAGDKISIGTGSRLGLVRPISADADVKLCMFADATVAVQGNAQGNTASVTGVFDGTKNVVLFFDAVVI